jgi:hypothetical protein
MKMPEIKDNNVVTGKFHEYCMLIQRFLDKLL